MSAIGLYLVLAVSTALLLMPGWLLSRALGCRTVSATVAWSLVLVFGALAITFALRATLTYTLLLLILAGFVLAGVRLVRPWPEASSISGRWWVFGSGVFLGMLLWRIVPTGSGDAFFHLGRVTKLLELDELSVDRVSEFADGSPHPGYAFPLWHGALALIARLSGEDPDVVVRYLPAVLAPLAVVIAYEVGWAVFRRTWAAAAAAAAEVALVGFAAGKGGAYVFLSLPATSSRHLLVPATLALAFEAVRSPSLVLLASTAAASFVLAVVHPTYALFLWIPFVGFLGVRLLWTRRDLRAGLAVLGSLVVPAALFMLWLAPFASDTLSVSPDGDEIQRAFDQYRGQLDVRSETVYSLAAEVFTRRGAIAIAALLLLPLAGFAARRRWSSYVVGGSLALFAVMLVPLFFTTLADVVSISQARRAAGFLPFALALVGGLGILSRLLGRVLPPLALGAGIILQIIYPGDFGYVLDDAGPAEIVWISVLGCGAALAVGVLRRGPPLESRAALAAALFLTPVFVAGLFDWERPPTPPYPGLSLGIVEAVRDNVDSGGIVYSDPRTSYRLAAAAPVYIAVAPPGHVADTLANQPYVRARDARRFQRTLDLAIPERYGATHLVVDRSVVSEDLELPVLYRDPRFVLYELPRPSTGA